jgi:DNA helicase HerA-like ATPase
MNGPLGVVTGGSLTTGIDIKLDAGTSVEDMAVGRYVTVRGKKHLFFGMITDIQLAVTDPAITSDPPAGNDIFVTEVLSGTATYGALHVLPMLTIGDATSVVPGPQPVKTVPSHFSNVNLATDADMASVFGGEDRERYWIGNPLDMETKLCLNLEEFVKRSNGIFGKSGTGKTFLTRILLIGMLQKSKAVNLIFDMHNEYGWAGSSEGRGRQVKALKQLFPSRVAVFTLDEQNARRRGASPDVVVNIGYAEIQPEDISLLRETLNLTEQAVEAAYSLRRRLGKDWIIRIISMTDAEASDKLIKELSIHEGTFQNLRRGLNIIQRLPFIKPETPASAVDQILGYLDHGTNVVLEFGRFRDITAYILVANLLSRRIYEKYQERTERAMGDATAPPVPLVITIEEAHKFLNPAVAKETIFGTIAREMRKYNVTLLVIDQRPSGIEEEIMSQLGTKITCLLDNEKDIDAVLAGVSGKNDLKSVLSRLAAKQQALIFGHAVPMPVAFAPREYGAGTSYKDFTDECAPERKAETEQDIQKLWEKE